MNTCPKCGTMVTDTAKPFCENCGALLPTGPASASGSGLFSGEASAAAEPAARPAPSNMSEPTLSSSPTFTQEPSSAPRPSFGSSAGSAPSAAPSPFQTGTLPPELDDKAAEDALARALAKAGATPPKRPAPKAAPAAQQSAQKPVQPQARPAASEPPFTQQSAFSSPAAQPEVAPAATGGLFGEETALEPDTARQIFPKATPSDVQRMPDPAEQENSLFDVFDEDAAAGAGGQTQVFGRPEPAAAPPSPAARDFDMSKVAQAAEEAMPEGEMDLFAPEEVAAGEEAMAAGAMEQEQAFEQRPFEEQSREEYPQEQPRQQAYRDDRQQGRQPGQQRQNRPARNNDPRQMDRQQQARQPYPAEDNLEMDNPSQQPRPMADYSGGAPRVTPPQRQGGNPNQPVRRPPPNYPVRSRSGGAGVVVRNILLGVLIFVVAAFVILVGLLYWNNRPAAVIGSFTKAVSERDYTKLEQDVQSGSVHVDLPEQQVDWAVLCDAFTDPEKVKVLEMELTTSAGNSETNLAYPAITVKEEDLFLFIKTHYIAVQGVELLAPGGTDATNLRVNGTDYSPNKVEGDGSVYGKFMPGLYTCQVIEGGTAVDEPVDLEAFQVDAPNSIAAGTAAAGEGNVDEAPPTSAEVTVSNCLSDEGVVSVDGKEISQKPSGGTVTIPDVPVGAEISIVVEVAGGQQKATVNFADPKVTSLSFGEYTDVEGKGKDDPTMIAEKATAADVNAVLGQFYTSYLVCINQQSMDPLASATDAARSGLSGRVTSPANAANTYEYLGAVCDENTLVAGANGDTPKLTFTATFTYDYAAREGEDTSKKQGSNQQNVEMLYIDGNWLVNSMTMIE